MAIARTTIFVFILTSPFDLEAITRQASPAEHSILCSYAFSGAETMEIW